MCILWHAWNDTPSIVSLFGVRFKKSTQDTIKYTLYSCCVFRRDRTKKKEEMSFSFLH